MDLVHCKLIKNQRYFIKYQRNRKKLKSLGIFDKIRIFFEKHGHYSNGIGCKRLIAWLQLTKQRNRQSKYSKYLHYTNQQIFTTLRIRRFYVLPQQNGSLQNIFGKMSFCRTLSTSFGRTAFRPFYRSKTKNR